MTSKFTAAKLGVCAWLILTGIALPTFDAQSQPALISTVPASGATGVSPNTSVQFSFDLPMESSATFATFFDANDPLNSIPVTFSWNGQQTILTCTPLPSFPANKFIVWTLSGEDITGCPLEDAQGFFTTGGTGGGTGSGTNRLTTFAVGKVYSYNQTSTGAPVLDPDLPYVFTASTTLASNRTATQITLAIPTRPSTNLIQNVLQPESWGVFAFETSQSQFESVRFPNGTYTFTVQAATSNQQVSVNLAANLTQPNAPHLSEYATTQSVDPAQAYTLRWDAFSSATANDFIQVQVGDAFQSPDFGTTGALNGLARSVVIPAGRLTPGQSYESTLDFYRVGQVISNASYVAVSYRISSTRFTLLTSSGGGSSLILTNLSRIGGTSSFDVVSSPGQTFTVEASSTLAQNSWSTVVVTNSPTGRLRITDSTGLPFRFYRARR